MEVFISIIIYGSILIILSNIKKGGKKGFNFDEMKKQFNDYFEDVLDDEVDDKSLEPVQTTTVYTEPEVHVHNDTSSVFVTPIKDELKLDEDDTILQVDRSLSQRNIKDPRALFSKKNIRTGFIVSEIMNKPKSLYRKE